MYEWFAIAYLVHYEKTLDFNNIYNNSKNAMVNEFNRNERRQRLIIFFLILLIELAYVYQKVSIIKNTYTDDSKFHDFLYLGFMFGIVSLDNDSFNDEAYVFYQSGLFITQLAILVWMLKLLKEYQNY
jgi:hypothetical protein